MTTFTISRELDLPYADAVLAVRAALADQGFGVITEIDLAATLLAKLGEQVPPQLILGACRPELAHRALLADPSIAAVLPCNVVVRAVDAERTAVEAFDPRVMMGLAGDSPSLVSIAGDAHQRLAAMLEQLA